MRTKMDEKFHALLHIGREALCISDQVLPRAQVLESCGLDLAAVDTFVGTSAGSIQVQ
jgi:hypothetical protein